VIGLYKTERVRGNVLFRTVEELEVTTGSSVDWFNTTRLHGALGNVRPSATRPTTTQTHDAQELKPATAGAPGSGSPRTLLRLLV
jgi:putative transposase